MTLGDKSSLVINGPVNLDAQSSLKLLDGTATISGISAFTDQAPTLIGGTLDVTGDMAVPGTATVYGSLLSPDAGKGFDASSGLVIGNGVGASIVFTSSAGTVAGDFTPISPRKPLSPSAGSAIPAPHCVAMALK